MIPPKGFKSELFPLRHRVIYSFGLCGEDETRNSTIVTLVKNYKSANAPGTVDVNPHHASFDRETGAICNPMSIIDRLNLSMTFTMTPEPSTDVVKALKFQWTPIFFSFPEKLDSKDDFTDVALKTILELVSDATEEDVTPLYSTVNLLTTGPSDKPHPASSVNFTEVFGTMNLSTNTDLESVAFDADTFVDAQAYYTNKGAMRASIGRTRHVMLTERFRTKRYFLRKFVPRAIRRIMPYSYMGILIHLPIESDIEQTFFHSPLTSTAIHLGCKVICNYHEWHADHNQDMAG